MHSDLIVYVELSMKNARKQNASFILHKTTLTKTFLKVKISDTDLRM